ncbi:hypothetical protein [Roseibium aggregatum]|nr:hypothetical protein [Roseibium aggregatum]
MVHLPGTYEHPCLIAFGEDKTSPVVASRLFDFLSGTGNVGRQIADRT